MAGSFERMGRPEAEDAPPSPTASQPIDRGPEPRVGDKPMSTQDVDKKFPGLYDRTDCRPPTEVDPHRSPDLWVADRNPGYSDDLGRRMNCGDCARASEATWRGVDTEAGVRTNPQAGGESTAVMDDWSPGDRVVSDFDDIKSTLEALGPGSSAIVAVVWTSSDGHWINAVNSGGVIKAVDGQKGLWETWPPSPGGLGFDEATCKHVNAIFVDAGGRHLKIEDLEKI